MGWSGLYVPTALSVHRCALVDFTLEDILLLSSSPFLAMCSVPTVDAPLPGMEKVILPYFWLKTKFTKMNMRTI